MKKGFRAALIDRDGVLRTAHGGEAIPGAVRWLRALQQRGIPFLIATNHTTSSPEEGARELQQLGFDVTPPVMHTPLSILNRLFRAVPPGGVYARGTPELLAYLDRLGITRVPVESADTILMGFDRSMNYAALTGIITALRRRPVNLIALHENRIYKTAEGVFEPGLGAWVRAVEYASGVRALIVGKPNPNYYRIALEILGVPAERTVMISDDPAGDLAGARRAGIATMFVTSGKYSARDLDTMADAVKPDAILNTIGEVPLDIFSPQPETTKEVEKS